MEAEIAKKLVALIYSVEPENEEYHYMNPRAIATLSLIKVIKEGQSLTEVISDLPETFPNLTESSFVKAVCYEVVRWYFQLQILLTPLMKKPLKSKDFDIYILLMVGLCQILFLRTSNHAAVTETVNAAKDLNKSWATHFINAVLRNFLRQQSTLLSQLNQSDSALYAHPNWLIEKLKSAWPEQWKDILVANNAHPPLSLRINRQKTSKQDFVSQLSEAGIETLDSSVSEVGLILSKAQNVSTLPGFSSGYFSVQDISAQLAAPLLNLQKNQHILDACAAPGGKTTHILELAPNIDQIVAIDLSENRLQKAKENLHRLGLLNKVTWVTADAEKTDTWWDGKLFDRILLDAPCSATGVIRRHPDIKVLRKPEDISKLVNQQMLLMNALWPLLKMGGMLMYATCSVLPEENALLVESFLQHHDNAIEKKIVASWGIECRHGRQILPNSTEQMDGFYYAALEKINTL